MYTEMLPQFQYNLQVINCRYINVRYAARTLKSPFYHQCTQYMFVSNSYFKNRGVMSEPPIYKMNIFRNPQVNCTWNGVLNNTLMQKERKKYLEIWPYQFKRSHFPCILFQVILSPSHFAQIAWILHRFFITI